MQDGASPHWSRTGCQKYYFQLLRILGKVRKRGQIEQKIVIAITNIELFT